MAWLIAKNALKDTLNQVQNNEKLARHACLLKDDGVGHLPAIFFITRLFQYKDYKRV